MSITLQYNYAQIELETYQCVSVFTTSDEIPAEFEDYIEIPYATEDYLDKYYNIRGDQKWYWDDAFTQLWVECPSH